MKVEWKLFMANNTNIQSLIYLKNNNDLSSIDDVDYYYGHEL